MAAITDDGSDVIGRAVEVDAGQVQIHRRGKRSGAATEAEIREWYDVAGTVAAIQAAKAGRVALQLPDALLRDATLLQSTLRRACGGVLFFVMADTLFAPCCVDEITAQHCDADMVVKYGHSCLTQTTRLPVHFVHPFVPAAQRTDLSAAVDAAVAAAGLADPILAAQPCFAFLTGGAPPAGPTSPTAAEPAEEAASPFVVSGTAVPAAGRDLVVVADDEGVWTQALLWEQYQLAVQSPRRLLLLDGTGAEADAAAARRRVQRRLRQRFFSMEAVKDAEVVAIVVVSLAIRHYAEAVEHMKAVLSAAGKQSIVVYVGKPNVPKLTNYEEVDAYCVIACPQSTWFDTSDYPKPVCTPVEVAAALCTDPEDGGAGGEAPNPLLNPAYYSLELLPVLRGFKAPAAAPAPDVSLLTGRVRHGPPAAPAGADDPEADEEDDDDEAAPGQLTAYKQRQLVAFQNSAVVTRMHGRSYKGLEVRRGETAVQAEVAEGLKGIASGYASEPKVPQAAPSFVPASAGEAEKAEE